MRKNRHLSWQSAFPLNEDVWFQQNQGLLLKIANTGYGRDILKITKNALPIVYIAKNEVRYLLGQKNDLYECKSVFWSGAPLADLIRNNWELFNSYARYFIYGQDYSLPMSRLTREVLALSCATLTAYPDANPETTTVDGFVQRGAVNESFATIRAGAGTSFGDDSENPGAAAFISSSATSNQYDIMNRGIALYDTSSLTASATISSGTVAFYGRDMVNNFSQSVVLDRATPASNTGLANSDFNIANWAGVEQASNRVTVSSWSLVAYNVFTLNATGLGNIAKTGVSKFGIRLSCDFDNSAPTWVSSTDCNADAKGAEAAGTSTDPKLELVYTIASFIPRIIIS